MPEQLIMFFDAASLILVLAASIAIAWVQNGAAAAHQALGILPALWSRKSHSRAEEARLAMVRVEQRVDQNGPCHADRIAPEIPFVADLAEMLANAPDVRDYTDRMHRYCATRQRKCDAIIGFWNDMADVAPAIGMIGTVVGLILMFDGIESADAIGQAMAICLLTSLYGLFLAHIIAGPIARRIALYSARENVWQADVTRRFAQLAEKHLNDRGVVPELSHWSDNQRNDKTSRAVKR